MKTILEHTKAVGDSMYWGEFGEWALAYATTRDADCLSTSNFRTFQARLKALPEFKDWQGEVAPVQIERFNHWACGWIDYLVIDPQAVALLALAESLLAALEDYPVLDEQDWSSLEQEEANRIWKDCYRPKERAVYIRKHAREFEFSSFADMLGCLRGNYFAGYASEFVMR